MAADSTKRYLSHEEIQAEELRLLVLFDQLCKEHDLRYSLDYGTLIGAVRYKGFIPWDDDMDVCMPRPDYEKLILLAEAFCTENAQLEGYFGIALQDAAYARFVSTRVGITQHNTLPHGNDYLWIDIFPVEGYPDTPEEIRAHCKRSNFPRRMLTAGFWRPEALSNAALVVATSLAGPLLRSYAVRKFFARKLKRLQLSIPYGTTATVGSLSSASTGQDAMPLTAFENFTTMEFEGREFPVMGCWHERLVNWYGDYMTPPPEDERTPGHQLDARWLEESR